jgi:hypothetical protein
MANRNNRTYLPLGFSNVYKARRIFCGPAVVWSPISRPAAASAISFDLVDYGCVFGSSSRQNVF